MKEYKLLIFDWDGTLVNSMDFIIECLITTAKELQLPITKEDLRSGIGLTAAEHLKLLFPEVDINIARECFYKHYFSGENNERAYEGAFDTLRALKKHGYTLAIATNKSRKGFNLSLARMQATELFATTRTGDEGQTKPHPDVIVDVLAKLDIAATHALMIGDTVIDMQTAKSAGVDALAVTYGIGKREHLREYAPIGLIDDVRHLHQLFIKKAAV